MVRFLPTAKYEPASYIGVAEILRRVSDMEWLERAALAELLAGNMHMHFFFVVPSENFEERIVDIERPDIADFVPVLRDIDGAVLAEELSQSNDFAHNFDGTNVVAEITDGMRALIAEIDGHRTLEEIYMSLAGKSGSLDWLSFRATYFAVHRILHDLLYGLFLRKRG